MTKRRQSLLALVAAGAVAVAAFYAGQPHEASTASDRDLLAAVPRDAFLVATIDMDALRASPLAQPFFGGDAGPSGTGAGMLGMGAIKEVCGFDPLARVRELALAIPEGGDTGDFGLVAAGDLAREDFVACAEKIIVARGGRPKVGTRGSFTTVEDDNEGANASATMKSEPKLALRDGGPFLIGRGTWLQAMIDAADGAQPSVKRNDAHALLRKALLARAEGKGPRAIVATATLPKSLRERLKREMGTELGVADAGSAGNASMSGVLGVEMAGVALSAGQETEVSVELRCESAEACAEVKKLIERKRLSFSQDFGVRLIGLGPLLDSLEVRTDGKSLSASARAPTDELGRAVDRVLQLRKPRPPGPPADPRSPQTSVPALPAPSANEVIVPNRDAGPRDAAR